MDKGTWRRYQKARLSLLRKAGSLPKYGLISFLDVVLSAFDMFDAFLDTVEAYEGVKLHFKPNLIFVGYDVTLQGSTVVLLAKKDAVLTATIQHGSNRSPDLRYSSAQYNFVFGPEYQQRLEAQTAGRIEVLAVGSTKYEKYSDSEFRATIHPELLGHQNLPPWLVALSGTGHAVSLKNHKAIITALEQAIAANPEEQFVIKLHPKDDEGHYEALRQLANVLIVNPNGALGHIDLADWIKLCKVMITGASASALEAFILEKPVITIDLNDELGATDFISEGVSFHCTNAEQLNHSINLIKEDGKALAVRKRLIQDFLSKYFCDFSIPASKRIAEWTNKLAS